MSYQSVNPFDGKTVTTFEELTDAQLGATIENRSTNAPRQGKLVSAS